MRKIITINFLLMVLMLAGCNDIYSHDEAAPESAQQALSGAFAATDSAESISATSRLAIRHITHETFSHSIANPRQYDIEGRIMAGVVPHHGVAAPLISGFFSQAAAQAYGYDLVIILAPNHSGELGDVVLSYKDWDIGQGLFTHRDFIDSLIASKNIHTVISHRLLEEDHSASILIPYIYHYLPNTKVAPILLNRSLSFGNTVNLFEWLNDWINHWTQESGKNVLLVASIDFSHFLTIPEAMDKDRITATAILNRDYQFIHSLNYHYLDSAAAMIIFLMYLEALDITPQIIDHTDASEFLGFGLDETTSYKVIVGIDQNPSENDPDYGISATAYEYSNYIRQVRLTFTGDLMLHEAQATAGHFDHSFSAVQSLLQSADLTIGNLETVLAGNHIGNGGFRDFPLFAAPDEFGYALKNAGFDILSTANNHSLDQGVDGLIRTLYFLEELGIDAVGTHRNQADRDSILIREVEGIRFAFLAYTYGTNGLPIPQGRDYLINMLNESLIRADIARARELADFVIVLPHMGNEYELFVRQKFKDWAIMMLEAGADIVIAGPPHVVQPMGFVDIIESGQVRRGFVAYCLGNFISSQRTLPREAGVMLNLYFERVGDYRPTLTAASYVPTWVKFTDASGNRDIIVLPVVDTLRRVAAGENLNMRQADILRMKDVHREISLQILGNVACLLDMQDEYFIP